MLLKKLGLAQRLEVKELTGSGDRAAYRWPCAGSGSVPSFSNFLEKKDLKNLIMLAASDVSGRPQIFVESSILPGMPLPYLN